MHVDLTLSYSCTFVHKQRFICHGSRALISAIHDKDQFRNFMTELHLWMQAW